MNFELKEAKDSNKTCLIDGFFIHSSYKPLAEAEKFVSSLTYSFLPEYILITEPGLSYQAEFLRKKFLDSKLICIRYCDYFKEYDSLWDIVFYFNDSSLLSDYLFDLLNEEGLSKCLFISWKASEKVFSARSDSCWKEIKKSVLKSRQVLATRSYFAKKWFINSVRNSLFINKTCSILKAKKPVILCASGNSLKGCIPFIKNNKDSFHIFCVSSALSPLLENGIVPELCISTDGGYYAKKHISFHAQKENSIVYAIPCEASLDTIFLTKEKIVPLIYGDSPGDDMFLTVGLKSIQALRNGTVSGTAAYLSLMLTESEVYFCGLDLSENDGFAHTQPNELELSDSSKDSFLNTKETRVFPQTLKNESLETYRQWFSNADFGNRLFRLSNNYNFKNNLNSIPDVNFDYLKKKNYNSYNENIFIENKQTIEISKRKKLIFDLIKQNLYTEKYINNILPAKKILLERCFDEQAKSEINKEIKDDINDFFNLLKNKFFREY